MAPSSHSSSKKKRNAKGVGVDFKKVKHKVGRKLPPAANATKIEVKSKVLVLPGQSLTQEKEGVAVNSRRQTLKDLLMQTSHHNENVRKEALLGIMDLLSRHPKELSLHAVAIIEKLSPRMTDNDKGVRQALLLLLRSAVFKGLPQAVMGPLVPVMMAYVCSAMTHLSIGIRLTAFSFLDLLVQWYPSLIVTHYKGQIVQHYVEFLGKVGVLGEYGNRLLDVLNGLVQFLSAVLLRMPAKGFKHVGCLSQTTNPLVDALDNTKSVLALHWYKSALPEHNYFTNISMVDCLTSDKENVQWSANEIGSANFPKVLAASLIRVLANCWAECAPSVCSGQAPDSISLDCMVSISLALHIVIQCITSQESDLSLCQKDRYMQDIGARSSGPYSNPETIAYKWLQENVISVLSHHIVGPFPICAPPVSLPKKVEEGLIALNMGICEVVLDVLMMDGGQHDKEILKLNSVLDYVEGALNGRMLPSSGLSSSVIDKRLFECYVNSLVHFIPKILTRINGEWKARILQAFTGVFTSCKATSTIKLSCLSSISEMLLPGQGWGLTATKEFTQTIPLEYQKQWLQTLPRILWELKHNHVSSSLAVLQVLHHLGRSAPDGSLLAKEYTVLQKTLIPFFCTFNMSKHNKVRWLYGPFIRLPIQCQELAVDLLYYHKSFSNAFLNALVKCCLCPEVEVSVIVRCVEVLQRTFCRGSIKLPDHISFLLTLVVPSASKGENWHTDNLEVNEKLSNFRRHRAISGVVCSCLAQIGDASIMLDLINPSICQQMVLRLPLEASYGLIKVISVLGCTSKSLYLPSSILKLLPEFIANHLVSASVMACRVNDDTIRGLYIHPCLALLSKSDKLTEMVISCLYSLSEGHEYSVSEREKQVCLALLQLFNLEHVRQRLLSNNIADSVLQGLKIVKSLQFKSLNSEQLRELCKQLHNATSQAYGWHNDDAGKN